MAEKPSFAAGTTMAKLSSAGKIIIGTKFDQPLFGQKGLDGKPVGFDVEIGKLIAAKLGIAADKIEWVETVSANREQFIKQGKVDMIVATYTINDKRKTEVDFAGPYYEAGQALMVNKDNTSITKPEDVKGKNVCSVTGSTPAATIVEKYGAVLVPAATYSACLEPLRNKQVEAITTDNVILAGFVAKEPDAFKLASDETFTKEPYGIGLKKDDTAFRMWINDQLEAFDKDGSYKKAWEATAGDGHQDRSRTSHDRPLLAWCGGCRGSRPTRPRQPPFPSPAPLPSRQPKEPMDVIIDNLPAYVDGFLRTLFLSVVSGIFALIFGTLLAAARVSPVAALRGFSMTYVEIVRNTPLTIAFFFAAVVLPRLGVTFQQFEVAAIIALSAYTSAFIAEAVRSGVNSVPVGQAEAARSIGMKFSQVLTLIILPQALRTVIPPMINILIALVKNSSVAGAFYVLELFGYGRQLANANGDAVLWVLVGVAFFYLLITVPLGYFANLVERKVAIAR